MQGREHLLDDGNRIGHVLEQEASVGDVECAPFVGTERQLVGFSGTKFHEVWLASGCCQAVGRSDLFRAAFDSHDAARGTNRAGHFPAELAQARAKIENAVAWLQLHFAQGVFIEQAVHQTEPVLLDWRRAVEVVGGHFLGFRVRRLVVSCLWAEVLGRMGDSDSA